jgi:hypothetical protein
MFQDVGESGLFLTFRPTQEMGSSSSKFKKYIQNGDEFAAMQVGSR